jgi:hypothetical protein
MAVCTCDLSYTVIINKNVILQEGQGINAKPDLNKITKAKSARSYDSSGRLPA